MMRHNHKCFLINIINTEEHFFDFSIAFVYINEVRLEPKQDTIKCLGEDLKWALTDYFLPNDHGRHQFYSKPPEGKASLEKDKPHEHPHYSK